MMDQSITNPYGHSQEGINISSNPTDQYDNSVAGTKRKRSQRPASNEDVPWTAGRCNRLLRTITSRINTLHNLRKTHSRDQAIATPNLRPDNKTSDSRVDLSHRDSPSAKDPDWMPQVGKTTRVSHYSGKTKARKLDVKGVSGGISNITDFRTPFVKRLLAPSPEETPVPSCSLYPGNGKTKTRQLPILPTTSVEKASRSLLEEFDALLDKTSLSTASTRIGASSLLSTCIRKIPTYLDFERDTFNHDNAAGTVEDIYDYLESFGSQSNAGWRELRRAVRAHAVHRIAEAILDSVLPTQLIDPLLDICRKREAINEGRVILQAWFRSQRIPIETKVSRLVAWCQGTGDRSFLYHILQGMLDQRLIHTKDLSKSPAIWTELIKACTIGSCQASAVSFFEHYVIACIGDNYETPQESFEGRHKLIYKAIILLTAFAWINQGAKTADGVGDLLHRLPVIIPLAELHIPGSDKLKEASKVEIARELSHCFTVSSLLLRAARVGSISLALPSGLETLLDSIIVSKTRTTPVLSETKSDPHAIQFINNVASTIARVDPESANTFIESTTTELAIISRSGDQAQQTYLSKLAAESAMTWAESCDSHAVYNLAGNLQDLLQYRLEEGLDEWIAKTPASKHTEHTLRHCKGSTNFHDSGIYTQAAARRCHRTSEEKSTGMITRHENNGSDEDELALDSPDMWALDEALSSESRLGSDDLSGDELA